MKATTTSKTSNPQLAKILYVGTTEDAAKLAPLKGLKAPVFLTDIYAGFFCRNAAATGRWGIVSVNIDTLYADMFAPSPAFIERLSKNRSQNPAAIEKKRLEILANISKHKARWMKSLSSTGVCVYTLPIPPTSIEKVMIYTADGRTTNRAINDLIKDLPNPYEQSPYDHKKGYDAAGAITRWLNGEAVKSREILNGGTSIKAFSDLDDKLADRLGLEMYYIKPPEKAKRKGSWNSSPP
jgi:hypothetical protein